MTLTDKEKIKEAVYFLNKLIEENQKERKECQLAQLFNQSLIYKDQNIELEKIKKK